jgi:hypothetical protein
MHSGFSALRAALPMNLKAHFPNFKVWSRAEADIVRITTIWKECLAKYGGPFLFGEQRTMADAMYAPVVTRFMTYDVKLDPICTAYAKRIMAMPEMQQWITAAKKEPEDIDELDVEFSSAAARPFFVAGPCGSPAERMDVMNTVAQASVLAQNAFHTSGRAIRPTRRAGCATSSCTATSALPRPPVARW